MDVNKLDLPTLAHMAGGLHGMLHGAWFGPQWSREGLPGRVAAVVLDEADALLGGGFADATDRVLEVCDTLGVLVGS